MSTGMIRRDIQSTGACMKVLIGVLLAVAISSTEVYAQNTAVTWSAFNMGFAATASATTNAQSVAGQLAVGSAQSSSTRIESGFLPGASGTTSVQHQGIEMPTTYALEQNYPNPFNPTTQVRFSLPVESHVRLIIYNTLGQEVIVLADEQRSPGTFGIEWDGRSSSGSKVGSGVYLYKLEAKPAAGGNIFINTKKMIFLK